MIHVAYKNNQTLNLWGQLRDEGSKNFPFVVNTKTKLKTLSSSCIFSALAVVFFSGIAEKRLKNKV